MLTDRYSTSTGYSASYFILPKCKQDQGAGIVAPSRRESIVDFAAHVPGIVAETAEEAKVAKHGPAVPAQGGTFMPAQDGTII